jgi:glycogen debranching enzyme
MKARGRRSGSETPAMLADLISAAEAIAGIAAPHRPHRARCGDVTQRLGAYVADGVTRFAVRAPLAEGLAVPVRGRGRTRHAMTREGEVTGRSTCRRLDRHPLRLPRRRRMAGATCGSIPPSCWSIPMRSNSTAASCSTRAWRCYGEDTADIVPRAVVQAPLPQVPHQPPRFRRGGLIYEVNVRGFTMLHPDVPEAQRGTIAALAHPA